MARCVAKSCDAGGTPPRPPSPAQERARVLFTLSRFLSWASFSHLPEWWQSERAEWRMLAGGTTPSAPAGTFSPDLIPAIRGGLCREKSSGHSFLPFILWLTCTLVTVLKGKRSIRLCRPEQPRKNNGCSDVYNS